MKKVQLTPKQISRILDVELTLVVSSIITSLNIKLPSEPDLRNRQLKLLMKDRYECNNLKIVQKSHFEDMREFDLLGETIKQGNDHWKDVMYKICHNPTCIRKIGFVSNFTYYDEILDDDKVAIIIGKLEEYHIEMYGNKTQEYTNYQRLKIKKAS